jgi:REP element-mobilizing transposase RayT
MTQSRASQISLDDTPYYHCICRCVRRAFLCGRDHYSGEDYEHRRQWVVDRLALLVEVFAVDLCAYAVMSNHYHLVLKIDRHRALSWSSEEVAARWMRLFSGHPLVTRWQAGVADAAETLRALEIIDGWCARLFDLGWFMKCLNEHLARRANEEDKCTGRFWESRYKSQALLDEKSLLRCMAYVDLNPVRAGLAETPETSDYTSVQQRSVALKQGRLEEGAAVPQLLPFVDEHTIEAEDEDTLSRVRLLDYLELVDATGRAIVAGKRGVIAGDAAGVLERLNIDQRAWLRHMAPRKCRSPLALGSLVRLQAYAASTGRCWVSGQRFACALG